MISKIFVIFTILLATNLASLVRERHFPLFHQCDPKWGNTTMGVLNPKGKGQDDTICHQGCAMSCVSMALNGYNITINGKESDPQTLNEWLRNNEGYTCIAGDCCNLVLNSVDNINEKKIRSLGEPLVPFLSSLIQMIKDDLIVIAHVQHRSHFVLITGIAGPSSFYVNDPFFPRKTYDYDEIHDILLYDII